MPKTTRVAAPVINRTVLMSGADYFDVQELNSYTHADTHADRHAAISEFAAIKTAVQAAGVEVVKVDAPRDCPDGIFTANWGLCREDTVVLSSLPPQRETEQAHAAAVLRELGLRTIRAPYRFSGQGDALPAGNLLFVGSTYRTDPRMHQFLADELGYEVIALEAEPERDSAGQPVINKLSGWPDSFFYDIDLALAVLRPDLVAWCPEAFTPASRERMSSVDIEKIEVSLEEALKFACNLISTGHTVIMGSQAPKFQADLEARGFTTVTPAIAQLAKGGGFIRCTTLTLDNE